MRYLFVFQDFVQKVEQCVFELQIAAVEIIPVAKRESAVPANVLARVLADGGQCALVQVDRAYRRSLVGLTIQENFKTFRPNDQVLRAWLDPRPPPARLPPPPREAFEAACVGCGWLVLADQALAKADEIAPIRWNFADKSAQILRRLALGHDLGPMRDWHGRHQVNFAANGNVVAVFQLPPDNHDRRTQWHLKDGDRTSREAAARVYFAYHAVGDVRHVLVLYVGPHPRDGELEARFTGAPWQANAPPR